MRDGSRGAHAFWWASSVMLPRPSWFPTHSWAAHWWGSAEVCTFTCIFLFQHATIGSSDALGWQQLSSAEAGQLPPAAQLVLQDTPLGEIARPGLLETVLLVSAPLLTLQGDVNSGISSPVGFLWQERKQDVLPSLAPQPREETAALCAPAWLPVRAAVMPLQWLHQKCIGQSKLDIKQVPQVVTAVGAPCQDPVQVGAGGQWGPEHPGGCVEWVWASSSCGCRAGARGCSRAATTLIKPCLATEVNLSLQASSSPAWEVQEGVRSLPAVQTHF